ncbi:Uncharacterized conserved protein YeaO, DUF488 family [Modicisalibacter ilicicola DSM 19980]|uniref:Uncharacterized conserved protein YeaO, DUF488 family n=1 Tax=Modicisalibacter ilicicola DSM 19980 TaxID=1121942 RepID=A0A1M4WZ57_9GAMM|nr:DUF488 family protein [Halomonas ilicicola]SHE86417.1 Uncharacterized conserved protein YeaO, DUF488 family [Halomonas ilicicola DSM 19980]
MHDIRLKRIYSEIDPEDGARVLVDRLWPRGKRRDTLSLTDWYRDASPSNTLRRQWQQGEISHAVFIRRYRWEMTDAEGCLVPLMRWCRQGRLTLLSGARNLEQSHLPVLRDAILEALAEEDRQADGPGLSSSPCYAEQFTQRHK